VARQRVRDLPVDFVEADVFGWQPPRRHDTVFFAVSIASSSLCPAERIALSV